ncbi:hypothetical protein FRC00_003678 [Tulasnella sp. 408]|nr:hypothetical protein FRC00_003678 [Tulasnella sp. 408]
MDTLFTLQRSPAAAPTKADSDLVLTVQAARWLLETTSNRGDQISTAQFICALDRTTCTEVFEDHESWKRLLNLTLGGLEIWSSQPNKENQKVMELFGLVLCRVLLQCSKEDEKWRDITDESSREPSLARKTFLHTFMIASSKYSPDEPEDDQRILHISVIFTAIKTQDILKEFQWTNPSRLLDGGSAAAASLLEVWARLVRRIALEKKGYIFSGALRHVAELWINEQDLPEYFSQTVAWSLGCFQSVQGDPSSELDAARGYAFCLRRVRELTPPSSELQSERREGLAEVLWSYIGPLTASGSTDIELLRLAAEALLTFKTFLPSHSSRSATPATLSSSLIESSNLIDLVVDVLLDGLASLAEEDEKWTSRGRTFKACVIRVFLWIWRNHPNRNPFYAEERRELFTSSCRLWAPLEKEVAFSKTGSFSSDDKPLTPEDLKGVVEFTEWVQTESQREIWGDREVMKCSFITCNADVEINRLYAHFERRPDWEYRWYDLHEDSVSCSRSTYREDGML